MGLAALAGAVALIVDAEREADQLRAAGIQVEAVVVEDTTRGGRRCIQQAVPVEFDLNGTTQRASVLQGCGDFVAGEILTLFVDPDEPTRLVSATGNEDSTGLVFIELIGVLAGVASLVWAVVGYARLRRARAVLRRASWTRRAAWGYDMDVRWARDLGVVVLVGGPDLELYVLGWAPLVSVPCRGEGAIEFARGESGRGVIARERGGTPRPVRLLTGGRRYRKALVAHASATSAPSPTHRGAGRG